MASEERKPKVVTLRELQGTYEDGECDDWLSIYDADIQHAVTHFANLGFNTVKITVKPMGKRGG